MIWVSILLARCWLNCLLTQSGCLYVWNSWRYLWFSAGLLQMVLNVFVWAIVALIQCIGKQILKFTEKTHASDPLHSVNLKSTVDRFFILLLFIQYTEFPLIDVCNHLWCNFEHMTIDLIELWAQFPIFLQKLIEQILHFTTIFGDAIFELLIRIIKRKASGA